MTDRQTQIAADVQAMQTAFANIAYRETRDEPTKEPARYTCECCGGKFRFPLTVANICVSCDELIGFEDQLDTGADLTDDDKQRAKQLLQVLKAHKGKFDAESDLFNHL